MFSLAIRLQVVGGGGVELHREAAVELLSELCNKLWASVGHICIGETMKFPDVLSVQVSSTYGGVGCVGWNEVSPLAIEIHNHQNSIIVMCV